MASMPRYNAFRAADQLHAALMGAEVALEVGGASAGRVLITQASSVRSPAFRRSGADHDGAC